MTDQERQELIAVMDGNELLETRICAFVQLPDGRAGAIWHGLAFPLSGTGGIDIGGPSVPLAECHPLREIHRRFGIIDGEGEAYILLEGLSAACEAAASAVRGAGVAVLRTGRYLGEPLEGLDADWFIRIVRPDRSLSLNDVLAPLLGTQVASPAKQPGDNLRARVLEAELLIGRAREAALQADLARLRMSAATSATEAGAQNALLEEALEKERCLRAEAELQAASSASRPRPNAPARLRDEIETVLTALLPRITLLRDSLNVVSTEYAGRRSLWRLLGELHGTTGAPQGWRKVQGVDHWWERHVSNGRDDAGRIYARWNKERTWGVLVSHKCEQTRDITWLSQH